MPTPTVWRAGRLLIAAGVAFLLAAPAHAQLNAAMALIDSPIKKSPEESQFAGETTICAIPLVQPLAALFGVDTIDTDATPVEFVSSELQAPFRVFRTDEGCNFIGSWTTSAPPNVVTTTGIAVSNNTLTYWAVHTNNSPFLAEYVMGTGMPTGRSCPLPVGIPSSWGPAVIDSSDTLRETIYVENVATDDVIGLDVDSCTMVCAFRNPDNTGMAAFGNGIGDAAFPQECAGAPLVISSGRATEGQVTRIGQIGCSGNYCPDLWDMRTISSFINGIDEFVPSAAFSGPGTSAVRYIVLVDNVTGEKKIVCRPLGIADCQGQDAGTAVAWVNGGQGGPTFTVPIQPTGSVSTALQRVPSSNGKFVYHFNAGVPDSSTLTQTLDLGPACFPFLGGTPSIVENNIGKTNQVGATNYFGNSRPNPSPSPVFVEPTQPVIDVANLPSGSLWTGQAIVVNPATSSMVRPVSLSNAIIFEIL